MTKINLVTGANGHLGNNLVRALLARGEQVRASVRNPQNHTPFEGLDCEIVQADLMDKDSLLRALEGVDTLYQVAAVFKHWARAPQKEIIEPNLMGTRNVLEAAASQGVERIVYVSSEVTLDDRVLPVTESTWRTEFHNNPYVQSKTESEQLAWRLADELGLDMVSVLPGAIIGPHCFKLTPTMDYLRQALNGEVFVDVNFPFTFVDARDVAAGMIAAAKKGRRGERYLLVTEEPVSTRQIIAIVQEIDPKIKMPPRLPKLLLQIMSSAMGFASKITGKQPLLLRSQVELFYGVAARKDISKARRELGFDPRGPETSLREAFDYLIDRAEHAL
ncbi:MAG: NAD-dependent epimerase/dehydratase family protein [Chloroflexi bacterium]|nr:NAD-dependent epimerase/dehydratase family protein [Chloroflexota bacterium]